MYVNHDDSIYTCSCTIAHTVYIHLLNAMCIHVPPEVVFKKDQKYTYLLAVFVKADMNS